MTNRTDDFNRADSTTSLGTPSDAGSAWATASGTWGISSNAAYNVGAGTEANAYLESSVSAIEVQVTISTFGSDCGVNARLADVNNLLLGLMTLGTGIRLFKRVSGTYTQLGSTYNGTLASGDVLKLRTDSANALTLYHNGTARVGPVTDAAGSTNTKHGIRAYADSTSRFDTFSITGLSSDITINGNLGNAVASGVSGLPGVAITVNGNVGSAAAAGITALPGVSTTINATTGNAVAAGTAGVPGVSITINATAGNAAAAGVSGVPGVSQSIDASVGNAVAAGVAGSISLSSDITINGTAGNAVAAGTQGLPGVGITVDGAAGNAVAAGISATVSLSSDITISGVTGDTAAAGITGALSLEIVVPGVIGNAVAAGTTATVTLSAGGGADPADVWNYVLSNGKTAEETAVETHAMLTAITAALADCPSNLLLVLKLLRNKQITNPSTGKNTLYDDDGSTVLLEGNLFEDAAGTTPYRGQGSERRERMT